jgi:PPK2 family polyphosphate:nucleotide phosphotransferase
MAHPIDPLERYMIQKSFLNKFMVKPGSSVSFTDLDPGWASHKDLLDRFGEERVKKVAKKILSRNLENLAEAQNLLWASDTYGILIILQAMDAAGKDGIIRHVMSGLNPQGCQVHNFKKPTPDELDHNFLWRYMRALPQRGRIGIFNRSYYEDVLVVKVHPELLENQKLPPGVKGENIWKHRYSDINHFEKHLTRNGIIVLKFYLHISKEEQRQRLLDRLNNPAKHWKFSDSDLPERACWDDYMKAYEDALSATSTEWAPWYIIPSNYKWASRTLVADILTGTICSLGLEYPRITAERKKRLELARLQLEKELADLEDSLSA